MQIQVGVSTARRAMVLAGFLSFMPVLALAQGVTVALLPAAQTVAAGDSVDLFFQVTQAGSQFNGFDLLVGFDPTALRPMTISPLASQQGSYMTGACGNTFHRFRTGVDVDTAACVLLCNGVSLPGPGQLYHLRFRVLNRLGTTIVRIQSGTQFYNAGLFVNPLNSTNAQITVGPAAGLGDPAPIATLKLKIAPNPMRSSAQITVQCDRAGTQTLTICDVAGRAVRHLGTGFFPIGTRGVTWDGVSDSGSVAPNGVYLARLTTALRTVESRIALVR